MPQKWFRAGVLAAFGFAAVALAAGLTATADDKKDEKLPSISEIMKKAHGKTEGYLGKLKGQVKDGKWDDAKKTAKDLVIVAEALAKNDPPKGDKESWEKLTKNYIKHSKSINEAAKKEEAKGVTDGLKALGGSCGDCHKAHRP